MHFLSIWESLTINSICEYLSISEFQNLWAHMDNKADHLRILENIESIWGCISIIAIFESVWVYMSSKINEQLWITGSLIWEYYHLSKLSFKSMNVQHWTGKVKGFNPVRGVKITRWCRTKWSMEESKYIWRIRQIHFTIQTNTHFSSGRITRWCWAQQRAGESKYIWHTRQIHFTI